MTLEQRLLVAHADDDRTGLVGLYQEAANYAHDDAARAFFLTQAFVFALETDHAETPNLRAALVNLGSEPP